MGQDLYPSAQEKAANLLYMVVKDHPFGDGNKRTGAALFAYFLDRNGIEIDKAIPRNMLTALTLVAGVACWMRQVPLSVRIDTSPYRFAVGDTAVYSIDNESHYRYRLRP